MNKTDKVSVALGDIIRIASFQIKNLNLRSIRQKGVLYEALDIMQSHIQDVRDLMRQNEHNKL